MAIITADEINRASQLWSCHSDEWNKARKKDWTFNKSSFLHKVPQKKHKSYRDYFLHGIDAVYIPASLKLWMTPIVEPGDAAIAFDYVAKMNGADGYHADLQAGSIAYASKYEIRCQTCPNMIQLFCEEILGDSYSSNVVLKTGTTFKALEPGYFSHAYIGALLKFFCENVGVDDIAYGFNYFLTDLKAGIEEGGYIREPEREAFIRAILEIEKTVLGNSENCESFEEKCQLTVLLEESIGVIKNVLRRHSGD